MSNPKPIYVLGAGGSPLRFANGASAVAIRPVAKGEKLSFVILDQGQMTTFKDQRINGVGVERYIQSLGYVVASAGDKNAEQLLRLASIHEGIALVEAALVDRSVALQKAFAGQKCSFIPFNPEKSIQPVVVDRFTGSTCVAFDLGGMSSGCVRLEYSPLPEGSGLMDVKLTDGWLAGADENAQAFPRNSDYGGVVELATFVVANSGLATLDEMRNLLKDGDTSEYRYPRGHLVLNLSGSSDRVSVIIDEGDELLVQYVRANGDVVCELHGMEADRNGCLSLSMTVGCIASVIVQARRIDSTLRTAKTLKAA